jgi:hypothetical protein
MGADKSDEDDANLIANMYDEAVFITFDIKLIKF